MCNFALIGARAETAKLREIIEDSELDTDVAPAAGVLRCFPERHAVLCVTVRGCSCALLEGLGASGQRNVEAHVAGPGYAFRRALATAVMRFGEVHLLTHGARAALPVVVPRRRTTLANLLRFGLKPDDGMVRIVA